MRKIQLTKGKYAIVDDDDYDRVSLLKWHLSISNRKSSNKRHFTAERSDRVSADKYSKYRRLTMQKFILGDIPDGMTIDHINRDSLDNRKSNLRVCTRSQNSMNRGKPLGSKHIYKGIYWHQHNKKYYSRIQINGKRFESKFFNTEIEAAKEYNRLALLHYGEFAVLNVFNGE